MKKGKVYRFGRWSIVWQGFRKELYIKLNGKIYGIKK